MFAIIELQAVGDVRGMLQRRIEIEPNAERLLRKQNQILYGCPFITRVTGVQPDLKARSSPFLDVRELSDSRWIVEEVPVDRCVACGIPDAEIRVRDRLGPRA